MSILTQVEDKIRLSFFYFEMQQLTGLFLIFLLVFIQLAIYYIYAPKSGGKFRSFFPYWNYMEMGVAFLFIYMHAFFYPSEVAPEIRTYCLYFWLVTTIYLVYLFSLQEPWKHPRAYIAAALTVLFLMLLAIFWLVFLCCHEFMLDWLAIQARVAGFSLSQEFLERLLELLGGIVLGATVLTAWGFP